VFLRVLWWVLHLGLLELQWLRGFGYKSGQRCPSDLGFIGRVLE
jgi:hypothetical protein